MKENTNPENTNPKDAKASRTESDVKKNNLTSS